MIIYLFNFNIQNNFNVIKLIYILINFKYIIYSPIIIYLCCKLIKDLYFLNQINIKNYYYNIV